jgi:uncharacterized membrane protein YcaP (DUF421 family)
MMAMIPVRILVIYGLMLLMIRVMGKRTIGNLTAFDMLIALMMGDLAGNAIYGQVPLVDAVTAITSLSAVHYASSWLTYSLPGVGKALEGCPTPIVKDGRLQQGGLRRERMSEEEALAELRLEGVDALEEVRLAQVEMDGQVSVLRQEWAEPAKRRDLEMSGQAPRKV